MLCVIVLICQSVRLWAGGGWVEFVAAVGLFFTSLLLSIYLLGLRGRLPDWFALVVSRTRTAAGQALKESLAKHVWWTTRCCLMQNNTCIGQRLLFFVDAFADSKTLKYCPYIFRYPLSLYIYLYTQRRHDINYTFGLFMEIVLSDRFRTENVWFRLS